MMIRRLPAAFEGSNHEDGSQHGRNERHNDQHRDPSVFRTQFCKQTQTIDYYSQINGCSVWENVGYFEKKKIKGGRAQAIKKQKQKSGTHYGHWAVCVFHQMSWSGRRGKKRCALSCGRHHRGRPIFRSFTTISFRPATNKHSIERNVCALFKMKQLYKQQGKEEENGEGSLPLLHILARSSVVCRRAARIDE